MKVFKKIMLSYLSIVILSIVGICLYFFDISNMLAVMTNGSMLLFYGMCGIMGKIITLNPTYEKIYRLFMEFILGFIFIIFNIGNLLFSYLDNIISMSFFSGFMILFIIVRLIYVIIYRNEL